MTSEHVADGGDEDEPVESESIVRLFDTVCFSFGDQDAIVVVDREQEEEEEEGSGQEDAVCYLEIQEASRNLAAQLHRRYRPDYVLVDCLGHAPAEAVSLLACLRIGVPFVPVDLLRGGAAGVRAVTEALARHERCLSSASSSPPHTVAICCCESDEDPILGVLYRADVHRVVYLDPKGNLREQLLVPDIPPEMASKVLRDPPDAMYVLFTSGTASGRPKAVVGSHRSTYRRLRWWRDAFPPSRRVARRTRLAFVGTCSPRRTGCVSSTCVKEPGRD
jgi:acyl-CoA synthetase (AMP-forming)/AMP-acid ligase II